jgi:HemY protein
MRWILLSVALMVTFSLLTQSLLGDPGYVIVALGDTSLRMRFLPALAAWVLAWLLFTLGLRLCWRLWRGLRGRGWRSQRSLGGQARLQAAWLHFFEEDWPRLLKDSLRSLRRKPDLIPALLAAQAYAQLGENLAGEGKLQTLLLDAQQQHPKQSVAIAQLACRLALAQGDQQTALHWIEQARQKLPGHKGLLRSLVQVQLNRADWPALAALLPDIQRLKVFEKSRLQELEAATFSALLCSAAQVNVEALQNAWAGLNRTQKQQEPIVLAYCKGLARAGRGELAEPLVRKALNQQWSDALAALYGQLEGVNPQQQLKEAQQWLDKHPGNLPLIITLANLCQRLHYWGQARDYWEEAHKQQACARSFAALAELYTRLGDKTKGQEFYERGLTRLAELEAKT